MTLPLRPPTRAYSRIVGLLTLVLLLFLGTACDTSTEATAPTDVAEFEWFEYEGKDPVYEEIKADAGEYLNPILTGFHPDPSIVRVGENDYYLVNSSFSYFPGLPLYHSTDLVHWEQLGHVLDRPSQLDLDSLDISEGIFAPTIRHHDGTFYVITTLVGGGGNFLVTAPSPEGPWSDPVWLPFDGIDPSLFFAEDGRVFITHNAPPRDGPQYDGHRAIWIQEYDPETENMVGPHEMLVNGGVDISEEPIWIEAPHLFKRNDTYYLIAAEGGTGSNHSEVVFRSDSVRGPYEPYAGNPILTQRHLDPDRPHPITSAGHADFVQTPSGEWWSVFLACRPYENDLYNTGRETFLLPVKWTDDGWPVITEGTEEIPYVHSAPDLPEHAPPGIPTSGNFTVRTDFEDAELSPYWNFIRTPREKWHHLESGALRIQPRAPSLNSRGQPSFVGRRQQHAHATATTALQFAPRSSSEKAGLAAFQNRNHYFLLSLTQKEGAPVLQLEKAEGDAPEVIASEELNDVATDSLYLRIRARGEEYDFSYAYESNDWRSLLEGADGTVLSTKVAGGFVGAYFGLYARDR